MRSRWILFSLLVVGVSMSLGPALVAQSNCVAFKALNQGVVFPDSSQFPPTLQNCPLCVWGGSSFAVLGAPGAKGAVNEAMLGYFFGKDAPNPFTDEIWRRAVGTGRNGTYQFTYGTWDNNNWIESGGFIVHLPQAIWTFGPGGMGLGYYQAAAEIESGTGLFLNATGALTLQGDFLSGPLGSAYENTALWNPELIGRICLAQ